MKTNNGKEDIGYEVMMSEDVKTLMGLLYYDSYSDIINDMAICPSHTLLLLSFKIIDSKLKIINVDVITPKYISTFIKDKVK